MSSKNIEPRQPFSGLKVAAIVIPLLCITFTAYSWNYHVQNVHPLYVITSDLDKIDGDMSVAKKIDIMTVTLTSLEKYHGNSNNNNPLAITDIDKTKQILTDTATEALTLINMVGVNDYAYQQGIININSHVNDIEYRIEAYAFAIGWNTNLNPVGWIIGALFSLSPLIILGVWSIDNYRYEKTEISKAI